jgi:hypothetical protein
MLPSLSIASGSIEHLCLIGWRLFAPVEYVNSLHRGLLLDQLVGRHSAANLS